MLHIQYKAQKTKTTVGHIDIDMDSIVYMDWNWTELLKPKSEDDEWLSIVCFVTIEPYWLLVDPIHTKQLLTGTQT